MKKHLSLEQHEARRWSRKRVRVVMPKIEMPFPQREQRDAEEDRAALRQWYEEIDRQVIKEVLLLADSIGADPAELIKAARWLIELRPPMTRGRPRLNPTEVLLPVAQLLKEGAKSDQVACDLAGVDPKSFRMARDDNPALWQMCLDAAEWRSRKRPDQSR